MLKMWAGKKLIIKLDKGVIVMSGSGRSIIKKMKNDGELSIDYYANVCRNDGGTSAVMSINIEEGTASDISLYNPSPLMRRSQTIYRYQDYFDLIDYESQIATDELTSNPVIMNKIVVGEQEINEGRKIVWRDVFRNS